KHNIRDGRARPLFNIEDDGQVLAFGAKGEARFDARRLKSQIDHMSSHDLAVMQQSVIARDPAGQASDQWQILQEWNTSDRAFGFRLKLSTDVAEADQFSAFQANLFQVQALSRLDVIKDF